MFVYVQGRQYVAVYQQFSVDQESPYRLRLSGFDAASSTVKDSLSYANGAAFTTSDQDNDAWSSNCAVAYLGAWWYTACHHSNLNGYNYNRGNLSETFHAKGIIWVNEVEVPDQRHYFSWPQVQMNIKKTAGSKQSY